MSQQQKETLLIIYRSIIGILLGVATFMGVSVYNKVDKTYDFVIKHEQQLNSQDRDIEALKSELKSLRYARNNQRDI